jgi:hypothetical protein
MKIITGANGKLETVGSADTDAKAEAQIRAEIAKQRVELRKMLDGTVQFHEDAQAKPVDKSSWKSTLPTQAGVYVACTVEQAATVFADPAKMDSPHYAYFNDIDWSYTCNGIAQARDYYQRGFST